MALRDSVHHPLKTFGLSLNGQSEPDISSSFTAAKLWPSHCFPNMQCAVVLTGKDKRKQLIRVLKYLSDNELLETFNARGGQE